MGIVVSPEPKDGKPPVALIAGPTASGKSGLAVRLAHALADAGRRSIVINADSAQVYRDLRILSARPSDADMEGVDHRLYGTWDGATPCSAADWARAAKVEIARAHASGAVPILCGGTGMYIRTLLDGIAPIPPIDEAIRTAVRALPQEDARAALEREDPASARRLAPADRARTCRALEVVRSTGKPLEHWHLKMAGGIGADVALSPVRLLPERRLLFERCDRRFAAMLDQGAIEEVTALIARKLNPTLPVMRAIGVRPITGLLSGELNRNQTIDRGTLETRQYAKRQFTWFRNQPPRWWPFRATDNINIVTQFETLFSLAVD